MFNIIYIKGDMVDVPVLAGADLGKFGFGHLVQLYGNVFQLHHFYLAFAAIIVKAAVHYLGKTQPPVKCGRPVNIGNRDADVLQPVDTQVDEFQFLSYLWGKGRICPGK